MMLPGCYISHYTENITVSVATITVVSTFIELCLGSIGMDYVVSELCH